MAKKSKKGGLGFIASILVAVLSVLVLIILFTPVLGQHGTSIIGNTDTQNYTTTDLLGMMNDNSILFFKGDNAGLAKTFTVFCLISFIISVAVIALAVLGIFFKKLSGYVKYAALAQLLLVVITFILAIVMTSKFSGDFGGLAGIKTTLGIGVILPLVGAVGAAVVPFVLKK